MNNFIKSITDNGDNFHESEICISSIKTTNDIITYCYVQALKNAAIKKAIAVVENTLIRIAPYVESFYFYYGNLSMWCIRKYNYIKTIVSGKVP